MISSVLLAMLAFLPAAQDGAPDGFRPIDPALTVYLDVPDGRIVFELNRDFAPLHTDRFLELVRSGFYDKTAFYRVIDGFVVQGGDGSDMAESFTNPHIKAEFERAWDAKLEWTPVQKVDPFAQQTGFSKGFAVGRDLTDGRTWLTHCPGTLAMARNNDADTASTDFYIVIGQAPRYLDRNMSIFGRVVLGMEIVQRILRDEVGGDGMIEERGDQTPMIRARVAADLPASERLQIVVTDTASAAFAKTLESRRNRKNAFFHFAPPDAFLDVCQIPVSSQLLGGE